jgi:adenylate kinase
MRVVLLGAPGVGKGTQAGLLVQKHGWAHLATGDILRDAVSRKTPLGLKAEATMARGDLVEDEVILGLIDEKLAAVGDTGFVLDGFPRTLAQARGLDAILSRRGSELDRVVCLTADDDEVVKRLVSRGRVDDTPDTIRHRLDVFRQSTQPLLGYYEPRSILRTVDGIGAIEAIHRRIEAALED